MLLLEQGRPDDDLLQAHLTLSPNRRIAQKELANAEKSARNLSPELRGWLASGGAKTIKPTAIELDETDDLSIAMALIVADGLRQRANADTDIVNDLRFKAPVHIETIASVFNMTRDLIDRVSSLAGRRQLRLFGSPGDIVEYSPYAYRLPDDTPLARRVRILSPGVEKCGRSASRVVVPALVDAMN